MPDWEATSAPPLPLLGQPIRAGDAIIGHWASVSSSFVGGVGTVLLRRHRFRSACGIFTGYLPMLRLGLTLDIEPLVSGDIDIELVAGLTAMAALVLRRGMIVRRRLDSGESHAMVRIRKA